MRLFGAVMVFLGCVGMALQYTSGLGIRIHRLEELEKILELIEGEIRYSRTSLPECFLQLGAYENHFSVFFCRVGKRALESPQESLGSLLREELDGGLSEILPPSEKEMFYEFATPQGYHDDRMQRRALERIRGRLSELVAELKVRQKETCKVAFSLGAMGGLFVIVLLL